MRRRGSSRAPSGQTATEYMLVISVIVCSLVAAAYLFIPEFQGGVAALAQDVSVALATGQVGGIGFARHGGGSGGGMAGPGVATAPTSVSPSNGNGSGTSGIGPNTAAVANDVAPAQGPSSAAAPLGNPPGPVIAAHALDQHRVGAH